MTTIDAKEIAEFYTALGSSGRSPEIPESADAYGWLIGSWELEVLHYWAINVADLRMKCEAHFARALEGRAIQDVWIMPRRAERTAPVDKTMNMYGTTLRVWDASIQAWRITWINPAANIHEEQIGGWKGKDIVQTGVRLDGTKTRWSFTEITPASFHWLGEAQSSGSNAWKLEGEFRARRMRPDR